MKIWGPQNEHMEKYILCKWIPKVKKSSHVFIADKIGLQSKTVKRDEEGYYTMIKGLIQQEL